jgi:broad specificity phosphatase PhoE
MDQVLDDHAGDIVLIVSHSNTIPVLIDELHGSKNLRPIGEKDFNRVYIVTIPRPLGKVKTLELFYPEPPVETPAVPAPVETPAAEPAPSASGGK